MWKADNWKDYEVLDTGNGEKLERWGEYLLVRPDPQVICCLLYTSFLSLFEFCVLLPWIKPPFNYLSLDFFSSFPCPLQVLVATNSPSLCPTISLSLIHISKKTVLNYNMQKRVMQAFPSEILALNTRISFGKSLFIRKFAVHPEIPALFRKDNFLFISPDNLSLIHIWIADMYVPDMIRIPFFHFFFHKPYSTSLFIYFYLINTATNCLIVYFVLFY